MEIAKKHELIQSICDGKATAIYTEEMPYQEWIGLRKKYIGGSDAGPIMSMYYDFRSYRSGLIIYHDKKGNVPFKSNNHTRRGKLLEPVVKMAFVEQMQHNGFDVGIIDVPYMFVSIDNPFMAANIDCLIYSEAPFEINGTIVSGIGGGEVKTVNNNHGLSGDEIPDDYYCQVQHYMAVLKLMWFIILVYNTVTDNVIPYLIHRNEEFIQKLIKAEKDFSEQYIEKNVAPAPSGVDSEDDLINAMFPGTARIDLPEAEGDAVRYEELREQMSTIKKQLDVLKVSIKMKMIEKIGNDVSEEQGTLFANAGKASIKWNRFSVERLDSDRIKKDGLYSKYIKTSITNRLDISLPKVRNDVHTF